MFIVKALIYKIFISVAIASLTLTFTFSCKKEIPKVIPTLTTAAVSSITHTTALGGGSITSDGGATIISRGVCWSTNQSPTIANSKTVETSSLNIYTSSIIGLNPSTTYYVRAYATNSVGTAYGSEVSFKTTVLTDIDGNVYNTVAIGTQLWMAENLKTTKYSNGNSIGTTTPVSIDISPESTPKYQWAYGGNENNVATYGRLYTWYVAADSRNVCPTGWHVPTDAEWTTLTTFLGEESVAGGKLKETGASHWSSPNIGASNSSGFTALPGGFRNYYGTFGGIGSYGCWWSSTTDSNTIYVIGRYMACGDSGAFRNKVYMTEGFSVRCLRDN